MRVTKTWLIPFLEKLADLLNHNFDDGDWTGPFSHRADRNVQTELRQLLDPVMTEQEDFYKGLTALLSRVAELEAEVYVNVHPANKKALRIKQTFIDDSRERVARGEVDLTDDLEDAKQVSSAQSFLTLHGMRWAVDVLPKPTDARTYFLWVVNAALKEGELSRLRVCRYCSRYFAAKNRSAKRISCGDQCRIDYWNRQHLKTGYHKKLRRMRKRVAMR